MTTARIAVSFNVCVCLLSIAGVSLEAQYQGGPVPPAIATGSPAPSSYALSGFDKINYFNGSVNIDIPIATIGGRGTASHTLIVPIQQQWILNNTGPTIVAEPVTGSYFGYDYTLGFMTIGSSGQVPPTGGCPSQFGTSGSMLSWLVWHAPDNTETVLLDTKFNGEPQMAGRNELSRQFRAGRPWPNVPKLTTARDWSSSRIRI